MPIINDNKFINEESYRENLKIYNLNEIQESILKLILAIFKQYKIN